MNNFRCDFRDTDGTIHNRDHYMTEWANEVSKDPERIKELLKVEAVLNDFATEIQDQERLEDIIFEYWYDEGVTLSDGDVVQAAKRVLPALEQLLLDLIAVHRFGPNED